MNAHIDMHREQIERKDKALRLAEMAIREAGVYVPEHHGPVNYKIDTAIAAIHEALGASAQEGENNGL